MFDNAHPSQDADRRDSNVSPAPSSSESAHSLEDTSASGQPTDSENTMSAESDTSRSVSREPKQRDKYANAAVSTVNKPMGRTGCRQSAPPMESRISKTDGPDAVPKDWHVETRTNSASGTCETTTLADHGNEPVVAQ